MDNENIVEDETTSPSTSDEQLLVEEVSIDGLCGVY